MANYLCDRCGRFIAKGTSRYIAKVQVFAADDPLEITLADLWRDHTCEMAAVIDQCESLSEEELMRDVFVEFKFDLCRRCQRIYVQNPLAASP